MSIFDIILVLVILAGIAGNIISATVLTYQNWKGGNNLSYSDALVILIGCLVPYLFVVGIVLYILDTAELKSRTLLRGKRKGGA